MNPNNRVNGFVELETRFECCPGCCRVQHQASQQRGQLLSAERADAGRYTVFARAAEQIPAVPTCPSRFILKSTLTATLFLITQNDLHCIPLHFYYKYFVALYLYKVRVQSTCTLTSRPTFFQLVHNPTFQKGKTRSKRRIECAGTLASNSFTRYSHDACSQIGRCWSTITLSSSIYIKQHRQSQRFRSVLVRLNRMNRILLTR